MKNLLALLGALTLVAAVAGAAGLVLFLKRGVSARAEPWAVEAWGLAGGRRRLGGVRPLADGESMERRAGGPRDGRRRRRALASADRSGT